jgi:hypothetical protein
MTRLLISIVAVGLGILGCKPVQTDNQRSPPTTAVAKAPVQDPVESSFSEWSGRSDLKASWTFDNVP